MKRIFLLSLLAASLFAAPLAAQSLYDNEFPLSDVELLDSPFKHAMEVNTQVLLQYDVDRLLAPFLKEAGLPKKAEYFPNWEGLDGHVAGHYVSALAIHYAATGNMECYNRLKYCISELKRCQDAKGTGYIGGIPDGDKLFESAAKGDFSILRRAWSPWYNVHKMYAGMRDAYQYAGIKEAKVIFLKMVDWAVSWIKNLSDEQMEQMLSVEFGGMNEIFADAYYMTGKSIYMETAKRFAHRQLLDAFAAHNDNLDNRHANTQIPKVTGYARTAALSNDAYFKEAAVYFWERVSQHRSIVIGGNSRNEYFPADNDYDSFIESREGLESCNSYNMLKLTEFLFSMDQEARYADFYEKALYNHILSTQHPEHGGYVYFTSMRPGHYRVYSQPNSGMWCCVGTGMENHGKYGEFIYTHKGNDELYVNLFIPSRLTWKANKATITQETSFPYSESSKLTVKLNSSKKFTMYVRYPGWCTKGYSVKVNGTEYATGATAGSYIAIDRKWKNGDVVEVSLPMATTVEELRNEPNYLAIKHGPIVLAAKTSQDNLDGIISDDGRWGHIAAGPLVPIDQTPIMVGTRSQIEQKLQNMKPVPGKPLHYTVANLFNDSKFDTMELEPFFYVHDSRYAIYFLALSKDGYDTMLDKIRADEEAMLALDRRTVDAVTPGEQQPETDHRMQEENSTSGNESNKPYRSIRRSGNFSYELFTDNIKNLKLSIGYWGNETTPQVPAGMQGMSTERGLEVLVDGVLVISEKSFPETGEKKIIRKEYAIPPYLLEGKEKVRITFRNSGNARTARVFDVRLVKY